MVALYERLWLSGVDDDDNESEMILALLRITPQQWICLAEWHFLYLPTFDKRIFFFFKFIDISFFAQIYVVVILHKLLNLKCFKFTQNLGSNILSDLTSGSWPSLKPSPGWPIQNLPKNFSRTMLGSVPSPNLPRKKFAICPTSVPCPSDHLKLTSPLRGKDNFDTIDTQGRLKVARGSIHQNREVQNI